MIAGLNILYQPTTAVALGGYMHGYITTTSQYCGTQHAPMVAVVAGEEETMPAIAGASFKVYPNPTTGSFILEVADKYLTGKIGVSIYNMHGSKLLKQEMTGERSRVFSLSGQSPGVYIIQVLTGNTAETVKVIKQ